MKRVTFAVLTVLGLALGTNLLPAANAAANLFPPANGSAQGGTN